jgi:hypothetical protein
LLFKEGKDRYIRISCIDISITAPFVNIKIFKYQLKTNTKINISKHGKIFFITPGFIQVTLTAAGAAPHEYLPPVTQLKQGVRGRLSTRPNLAIRFTDL